MSAVLLKEYIHPDAKALLEQHFQVVDNLDHPEAIQAIVVRTLQVDGAMMDLCPNLKIIAKHGVGVNTIDLAEAKKRGIIVTNTPRANSNSVAELIVGLMLDAGRNITLAHQKTQAGAFAKIAPAEMTGMELTGKTLGLVGTGNIARRVAEICTKGFGMNVLGYDPFVTREQMEQMGYIKCDKVDELIAGSDVINVSVPLTPDTKDLISGAVFDCFRPGAILINAARGGIVNEADLYQALKAHKLRAAACDAFVNEPPTRQNTNLYELDNFIGTPHIGACAEEALWRMGQDTVTEIINVLSGKAPTHRLV